MRHARRASPHSSPSTNKASNINQRGMELYAKGRYKKAATLFDRALKIYPRHADAHWGRGLTRLRLGDRAGAAIHLDRAEELGPADLDRYVTIGSQLQDVGEYDRAANLFGRALNLDPTNNTA